jgi:hypothetical protein
MDKYADPEIADVDFSINKIVIGKRAKSQIESIITENFPHSIPLYCNKVGIASSNYYAVINGTRPCTLDFLNKLLSGVGYQISIDTKLIAHQLDHGPGVPDVDFTELVPELPLKDEEGLDEYDSF